MDIGYRPEVVEVVGIQARLFDDGGDLAQFECVEEGARGESSL